jgi:hypothetical protein
MEQFRQTNDTQRKTSKPTSASTTGANMHTQTASLVPLVIALASAAWVYRSRSMTKYGIGTIKPASSRMSVVTLE